MVGVLAVCVLRRVCAARIDVTVYERTKPARLATGLPHHINPHGAERCTTACRRGLAAVPRTVSVNDGGFGFATEQLNDLLRFAGSEILPEAGPAMPLRSSGSAFVRCCCPILRCSAPWQDLRAIETASTGGSPHTSPTARRTADVLIGADGPLGSTAATSRRGADRHRHPGMRKQRLDGANLPRGCAKMPT